MVDVNGHEAGNGGHSQGKPTAYRGLLYSERSRFDASDLCQVTGNYQGRTCLETRTKR
jgi:hypothetical protein